MPWLNKKIFLIDGLGAVLSALLLGLVLTHFASYFGMPIPVLHSLAITACGLACYSFGCFFFTKQNPKVFLAIILVLNLLYCLVTSYLIFLHFDLLTTLGVTYFVLELFLILFIVRLEYLVLKIF